MWRRSYDTPPPALEPTDERAPFNDPRYAKVPREQLPLTECLKDTVARVLPLWNESIAPAVRAGKQVLIAAHGNSLRALMYLDGISDSDIVGLNIPNGVPLVYELDENLKPIKHYYLGDRDAIAQAQAAVAKQGRADARRPGEPRPARPARPRPSPCPAPRANLRGAGAVESAFEPAVRGDARLTGPAFRRFSRRSTELSDEQLYLSATSSRYRHALPDRTRSLCE